MTELVKYPLLNHALDLIAGDNNMCMLHESEWPKWIDLSLIELALSPLPLAMFEEFCTGEEMERDILISQYGLQEVNVFLNLAFDSTLTSFFFK